VAAVLLIGAVAPASAISAWARRYGASCSMCHFRVNELNGTGKEFLRRGHRLPGESATKDGKDLSISDFWSITEKIRYEDSEGANSKFDVEALSIYLGGPLDERWSFFTEQYLHESNSSGADREKLAESAIQYNSSTSDDYWSFRAGQINPFLIHTDGESGARLPLSRPVMINDGVASVRVGTTTTEAPLYNTYRPRARNYGIEIARNWSRPKVYAALGIVNGTGHAPPNINIDPNNSKDVYLTIDKTFDTQGSSLGLYYYTGSAVLSTGTGTAPPNKGPDESFWRLGFFGNVARPNWKVIGAYLFGSDDTLTGVTQSGSSLSGGTPAGSVDSAGYFLQIDYLFNPIWSGYVRYDSMDPYRDGKFGTAKVTGPTIGVGMALGKWVLANVEYRSLKTEGSSSKSQYLFQLQWMY